MTPTTEAYERLGQHVRATRRRAGYETRESFADHIGITSRVLADVETGKIGKRKHGFSPDTLDAIDAGLGWAVGTCAAILAGAEGPGATLADGDPVVVAIDNSELTRANKAKLTGTYYEMLDSQGVRAG